MHAKAMAAARCSAVLRSDIKSDDALAPRSLPSRTPARPPSESFKRLGRAELLPEVGVPARPRPRGASHTLQALRLPALVCVPAAAAVVVATAAVAAAARTLDTTLVRHQTAY